MAVFGEQTTEGQGRVKETEEEATVIIQARDNDGLDQGGGMGDEQERLDIISDSAKCIEEDETG